MYVTTTYLHVSPDNETFALGVTELKEFVSDGLHGIAVGWPRLKVRRHISHARVTGHMPSRIVFAVAVVVAVYTYRGVGIRQQAVPYKALAFDGGGRRHTKVACVVTKKTGDSVLQLILSISFIMFRDRCDRAFL